MRFRTIRIGLRSRMLAAAIAIAVAVANLLAPSPAAAAFGPIRQSLHLDGDVSLREDHVRHHYDENTATWEDWDMGSYSYQWHMGTVDFRDLIVADVGGTRQIVSGAYGYPTASMTTVWNGMNADGSLSSPDAWALHVTEVRPTSIVLSPELCGYSFGHLAQNVGLVALKVIPGGNPIVTVLKAIAGVLVSSLSFPPRCGDLGSMELPAHFDAYGNLYVDYQDMDYDEWGRREPIMGMEYDYFTTDYHYRFFVGSPDYHGPTDPLAVRYSGPDRFSTAVDVSRHTFPDGASRVYVANAYNFPDALSAAAAAGWMTGPVLLSDGSSLDAGTAAELRRLAPNTIVVVGSSSVVSDGVLNTLKSYAGTVVRCAGSTRFETAVAVSKLTFPVGATTAYVAYAYDFPDALAGAAAAGWYHGPVLLTGTATLDPATQRELDRLNPSRIVVLGSSGIISDAVFNQIRPYAGAGGVVRYAGPDRFSTAAAVSAHTFPVGVPVAYIAYAYNFPDALAGAAAAGTVHGPVLLVDTYSIPAATIAELQRLKPKQIIVLGSSGIISDAVMNTLTAYAVP